MKSSNRAARRRLKFRRLSGYYAVVRLAADAPVPDWVAQGDFTSITHTSDELSIVCRDENVPAQLRNPQRWVCFKLEGPFAFSETGRAALVHRAVIG
jgi:uncharacterized protein